MKRKEQSVIYKTVTEVIVCFVYVCLTIEL